MNGDLSRRESILQRWRANMDMPAEPDAEFEAFLEEEGKEIDEILASLGPKLRAP